MSEESNFIPVMSDHDSLHKIMTGFDYTVLCLLMSKLTFNVLTALDLIKNVYLQLSMLSFIVLILYGSSATLIYIRARSSTL